MKTAAFNLRYGQGRTAVALPEYSAALLLDRIGIDRLRMANDGLNFDIQSQLCVNPLAGSGNAAVRVQRFADEYLASHPQATVAVIPEGPYTMLQRF